MSSEDKRYRILFISDFTTTLPVMTYLIEHMTSRYPVEPVLLCDNCRYKTDRYRVLNVGSPPPEKAKGKVLDQYSGGERRTWRRQARRFLVHLKSMWGANRRARAIMRDVKPDAVVVADDRQNGLTQGLLKQAKHSPVIRVAGARFIQGLKNRTYDLELEVTDRRWDVNRLPARLNPHWALEENGQRRLFYPAGQCMAGLLTRQISMNPWASGAGQYITVAFTADSKEAGNIRRYAPDKDTIVTGLVEDYEIQKSVQNRQSIRQRLRERYDAEQEKIIIFSIPQMPEHNFTTWEIHRHNVRLIAKCVEERYGSFLLSLHPRSDASDYDYLTREYQAQIMEERLRDAIAGADLLITVNTSSVTRWANILGIQTLSIPITMLMSEIPDKETAEKLFVERIYDPIAPDQILDVPETIMNWLERNNDERSV